MALSYAQKQMAKRRSGDINRLTSDYQRAVEQYKQNVGAKETAFKGEIEKYNQSYGEYEQKSTAYQTRLLDYMNKMKEYQAAPTKTLSEFAFVGGVSGAANLPEGYYRNQKGPFVNYKIPEGYEAVGYNPQTRTAAIMGKDIANPGAFTEKFEEKAPDAPASMDISAERAALQGEKDYTEREIDERKKSRLRAVGRGAQRSMLSAGTNISSRP
jgi:hypothetical protein